MVRPYRSKGETNPHLKVFSSHISESSEPNFWKVGGRASSLPLWSRHCLLRRIGAKQLKGKLHEFQFRGTRVITGANYHTGSADVLETLSWEALDVKQFYAKLVFICKVLSNSTAPNLKESYSRSNVYPNTNNFRNRDTDLARQKPRESSIRRHLATAVPFRGIIFLRMSK